MDGLGWLSDLEIAYDCLGCEDREVGDGADGNQLGWRCSGSTELAAMGLLVLFTIFLLSLLLFHIPNNRYENVTIVSSSVNWRKIGAIAPIKDQGKCC